MHLGYSPTRYICEREAFEILNTAMRLLIETLVSELEASGLLRWCSLAWGKVSR